MKIKKLLVGLALLGVVGGTFAAELQNFAVTVSAPAGVCDQCKLSLAQKPSDIVMVNDSADNVNGKYTFVLSADSESQDFHNLMNDGVGINIIDNAGKTVSTGKLTLSYGSGAQAMEAKEAKDAGSELDMKIGWGVTSPMPGEAATATVPANIIGTIKLDPQE